MHRRLRTEEIRRKRAEARAAIRGHRIGTEVACRVACAHGHEKGCLVYFVARLDGAMLHVSSDCSRSAPPEDEVAVMRGLMGVSKYRFCGDVVDGIKRLMAAHGDWHERRHAMQSLPIDEESHTVLWHAVEAARIVALDRHDAGDVIDNAPSATLQLELRRAAFDVLMHNVSLPAEWRMVLRWDAEERTIVVYAQAWSCGKRHKIATYRSGGRFVLRSYGLRDLARSYYRDRPRDRDGKKPCTVCGSRITSPSSHVKTNRHNLNVEAAVLDALEVIGQRLARRTLTQPAQVC